MSTSQAATIVVYDPGKGEGPGRGKGEVRIAAAMADLRAVRGITAACFAYLASVALDTTEKTKHRVAAARVVVAHGEWREGFEDQTVRALLSEQHGNPRKALAWIDARRAELMARIEADDAQKAADDKAQGAPEGTDDDGT